MKALVWILILEVLQNATFGESSNHPSNAVGGHQDTVIEKRSVGDPFSRRSAVDKNFIRFGRSSNFFHQKPGRAQKNHMSLARVSRATKDNIFQIGRPDFASLDDKYEENDFMRFGRGKQNFIRLGRGKENYKDYERGDFSRLGRKDNFIRFGRGKDNFIRFGRGKDNFMRFGRTKDKFIRFGRKDDFIDSSKQNSAKDYDGESSDVIEDSMDRKDDIKESFDRLRTLPEKDDPFIRFARSEPEIEPEFPKIDDDGSVIEIAGDLVLQADKPKNGPTSRSKRGVEATTLWEVEENSINRASRDAEVLEDTPPQTKNVDVRRSVLFEPNRESYGTGNICETKGYSNAADART